MSTFSSLNAASTALWAAQRGLEVTGQNVANSNTDGYSRESVQEVAIAGATVPAMFSTSPGVGSGVAVAGVVRNRDMLLEAQSHTQNGLSGALTAQDASMTQIQQAFREPGTSGLQSLMDTMFGGWGDVANNPQDSAARTALLQQTDNVIGGFHSTATSLGTQWNQTQQGLTALVTQVNSTAQQIADLNIQIASSTQAGLDNNDLLDKRDLLIGQLSKQIGATSQPGQNDSLSVYVAGTPIVFDGSATLLKVAGGTDPSVTGTNPVVITTATGTYPLPISGGTAGGNLTTLNKDIPNYFTQLNKIAANLAATINTAQAGGYDATGNHPTTPLFGTNDGSATVTAANLSLTMTDPNGLAASNQPPQTDASGNPVPSHDGSLADQMAQLQHDPSGPSQTYRQMIVNMGVQANGVGASLTMQNQIVSQVNAAIQSSSGVNVDEEMTNMMAYQHAYEAGAKMITTVNATLDSLMSMF